MLLVVWICVKDDFNFFLSSLLLYDGYDHSDEICICMVRFLNIQFFKSKCSGFATQTSRCFRMRPKSDLFVRYSENVSKFRQNYFVTMSRGSFYCEKYKRVSYWDEKIEKAVKRTQFIPDIVYVCTYIDVSFREKINIAQFSIA